jgi:hypothetical protein
MEAMSAKSVNIERCAKRRRKLVGRSAKFPDMLHHYEEFVQMGMELVAFALVDHFWLVSACVIACRQIESTTPR